MPPERAIRVLRARTHNLKSVSCEIPLGELTVISGPSGSGKSSLAFDTLYAEGQRRYVASLSTYARQFLERLPRPDVDNVSHLPPAIAIEQRNSVTNARSTVGSATELLDHLRLLMSKIGVRHCCGAPVLAGTVESISREILERFDGTRISVGAPVPDRKDVEVELAMAGYTRFLLENGDVLEAEELPKRGRRKLLRSALSLIDRIAVREDERTRLAEAVADGLARGDGRVIVRPVDGESVGFNRGSVCDQCGTRYPEPEPALFSWNSALGACPTCEGFGRVPALDIERLVPDPERRLRDGAIAPFATPSGRRCQRDLLKACKAEGISRTTNASG